MRKKGFTLIELLVVIAIIAMLLAILMPALNKVKKIAQRVVCGTNLKGMGTAQTVYANEYRDSYTLQGRNGAHTLANQTGGASGANSWQDKGKNWSTAAPISVGATLYLLVREADVSPKSFICPSSDQKEFSGKNAGGTTPAGSQADITELWDFGHPDWPNTGAGEGPTKCVSYSYHMPYAMGEAGKSTGAPGAYAARGSTTAAFALMADRNPWLDSKLTKGTPAADTYSGLVALLGTGSAVPTDWNQIQYKWSIQVANAYSHSREGQNVLFGDGHSEYTTRPDVGVTNDGIYTSWTNSTPDEAIRRKGGNGLNSLNAQPTGTASYLSASTTAAVNPKATDDSVLVND